MATITETPLPRAVRRSRLAYYLSVHLAEGSQAIYVSRSRERLRALWRRHVSTLPGVLHSPAPWLDWISQERDAAGRWVYRRDAITSRRAGVEILDPEGVLT